MKVPFLSGIPWDKTSHQLYKNFRPFRLSWESKKKNIQGYHTWLIVPTDEGCKLITSEAQHGFLTFMQKVFLPNKLSKLHDIWLLAIKQKAEKNENIK